MSDKVLGIRIKATDEASPAFKKIADGATRFGSEIEKAGDKGEKSLTEMGKAAEQSASKMDQLKAEATAVGAAMGTLFAGMSKAGAAFRDQQRQVDGINRLYGDQADVILDMTENIQEFTRYSNDAARESALITSSLASNYDMSAEQISLLVERSADLAQIYGYDLPDAVQRTSSALRGEGESAEMLGLNLSDAAIAARALDAGITNWNVPGALSEAEKAAFRFQLFLEDTESTVGAAADAASGAGGGFRELINIFDDGVEAVGGFLGPVGEVAAEMAPIAIVAPVAGAAMGRLFESMNKSAGAAKIGRTALAGLGLVLSPLGLVMTGVVAVGGLLAASWLDQKQKAEEYRVSLSGLDDTLEMLRRRGDTALADVGEDAKQTAEEIKALFEAFNGEGLELPQPSDFTGPDRDMQYAEALTAYEEAIEKVKDQADLAGPVIDKFNEALSDPNVNAEAFLKWADGLMEAALATETTTDDVEALQTILDKPLSDFSVEVTGMNNFATAVKAARSEVESLFSDLPAMLDDLRLDGQGDLANDLEGIHTGLIDAFTIDSQEAQSIVAAYGVAMPSPEIAADIANGLASSALLTKDQIEQLGPAWDRIMQGMESGVLDNIEVMAELNRILSDESLTPEAQLAAITALSYGLNEYVDSAKAMQEQQKEFLANGANILDWWQEYDAILRDGGMATIDATTNIDAMNAALAEQEAFRGAVQWAEDIGRASAELDQVLRTYEQIDSLGQRSATAGSIAENLVGEPGVWSEIDDLLQAGTISVEQYNEAIAAGHAIQESNLRVQEDLNQVRRDQLPLLAEEQLAYEQNIEYLTGLEPLEQRRALMLQDTAVQSKIASDYALAYSASIGEIPEAVATEMILESANADAALKDIYLQMGLIEEDPVTGEIRVNFPDADATISSINRMTLAFLHFQAAAEGKDAYTLAVEIYGEEEAMELFGMLDEKDGTTSTVTLTAEDHATEPVAEAWSQVQTYDGSIVTVYADGDGSNAIGMINEVDGSLISLDGDTATVHIKANDMASGVINGALNALNALNGKVAETTIRTVYESRGIGPRQEMGGVPGFENGGLVPFYAGEGNRPELARFANGGTAVIPTEGFYAAPPMTRIVPNNGNGYGGGGGDTYELHFHIGGSVVGENDLLGRFAQQITQHIDDRNAAIGVRR